MNNENIKEILKSIGAEQVPADVQRLAQETSNNFTQSLTQQQEQPRRHVLLEHTMRSKLPKLAAAAVIVMPRSFSCGIQSIWDSPSWTSPTRR